MRLVGAAIVLTALLLANCGGDDLEFGSEQTPTTTPDQTSTPEPTETPEV